MTKLWWKAAVIRAVKTMAQTCAALIGTATFISQVDWLAICSASLMSGLLSVLTSISTGLPEVDPQLEPDAYEDDVDPVTEEDNIAADTLEKEADQND